jgi:hypothetical protein
MPKELSHILIAKEVLADMKRSGREPFAQVLERNMASFCLGAIIPDAFFYDMTPLLKMSGNNLWVSRALHEKKHVANNDKRAVGFFEGISALSPGWEAKAAFAAGIVTHTVSDRMVHGVIDYVTRSWGETDGPAMATHRQMETLMDMVLLEPWGMHPRQIRLDRVVDVDPPTRDMLFRFHLSRLAGADKVQGPCLLRALNKAHVQQCLFLRLFVGRGLYAVIHVLDRLASGRLGPWSSLFYPEQVGTRGFPIMKRLNLNALTDGRSFSGPLSSLVKEIVKDAVFQMSRGFQKLGQGS